jgi:hypothetical protein
MKEKIKKVKRILKKFDFFAVPFSFRYQTEDKYSTSLGGFFFLSFCVIVVVVMIYYFIPFFNRKNFSIVYYSMNLDKTEQIKLKDSKTAISFGLDCDVDKSGTKVEDVLNFSVQYLIYQKDSSGNKKKLYKPLSTHPCNYSDFYNSFNHTLDILSMSSFQCLDQTDDKIEGIYSDDVFSYYELSVYAKEDSVESFQRIDDYLTENDCKLSLYYTDYTFDVNDYEKPIKNYINEIFIQLNPTLYIKANVFFMNQYFENDNYLVYVFEEGAPLLRTLFSRVEDYALYKGLNRGEKKPSGYKNYAKFYVRADTKKTEIKRKYQKVIEFYADSSSMLIGLFEILLFIFNYINSFYADNSFAKRLFIFKDAENEHIDINKRQKQIKQLLTLTEPLSFKNSTINNNRQFEFTNKNNVPITDWMKNLENNEIRIYNKKRLKKIDMKEKEEASTDKKLFVEIDNIENKNKNKKNIKIIRKILKDMDVETKKYKEEFKNNLPNIQSKLTRNDMISKSGLIDTRFVVRKHIQEETDIEEVKSEKIDYSYNIFEIIISSFLCCCMSKKLKRKKNLTEKANALLYNKLDIVLFVRNMILLDIINETLVNNNNSRKGIIKFLSRPVISEGEKENIEEDSFYTKYDESDFDNFYGETSELARKVEKEEIEKKLIFLSYNRLKNLICN